MSNLDYIEEFIIKWDMGNYPIRKRVKVLKWLERNFPYEGIAYRGGDNSKPKPPVSWTKDLDSLLYYWHHVGISNTSILAWQSDIDGIDVSDIAEYYIDNASTKKEFFRAERLISFKEVLSLYVPEMMNIGKIKEIGFGPNREVIFRKRNA